MIRDKSSRKQIIDYKTFGEFCRACRKKSRLSQTEVGQILGFSGNHISEYERGNVDSLYLGYAYAMWFGATLFNYIEWCSINKKEIFNKDLASLFSIDITNVYPTLMQDLTIQSLKDIYTHKEMRTHITIKQEKSLKNALYGAGGDTEDELSTTDKAVE